MIDLLLNPIMFRRKLTALGYSQSNEFNATDDTQFKKLVVWLEDQKIRHYAIENRTLLKNIQAGSWKKACDQYLKDLSYPFSIEDRNAITDWLLGLAVRLDYGDNVEEYQSVTEKKNDFTNEQLKSSPIYNIKETDVEFKKGVRNLAKILEIPLHEDDKVTLQSVVLLVEERLSEKGIANFKATTKKNIVPLQQQELGFDTGDEILNNAARALRLLHINELRQLQTDINNAIVSVQSVTANPKTDQRLGKVGKQ